MKSTEKVLKFGNHTYKLVNSKTLYILIKNRWIQTVLDKQMEEVFKNK